MGCFQTRILEWVAPSSSRESSHPRDQTRESCICCIDRQILYSEPPGKPTHRAGSEILLETAAIWTFSKHPSYTLIRPNPFPWLFHHGHTLEQQWRYVCPFEGQFLPWDWQQNTPWILGVQPCSSSTDFSFCPITITTTDIWPWTGSLALETKLIMKINNLFFYATAFKVHFQQILQKPELASSAILEMHC